MATEAVIIGAAGGAGATPESNMPAAADLENGGGDDEAGVRPDPIMEEEPEEIQVLPTVPQRKPVEVFTIDDSDDDEDKSKPSTSTTNNDANQRQSTQDGQDPDLQIIEERPYSFMNRSRGPKQEFLRNLLQQNNRKIEQGGKVSELNTMEPGTANILLPVRAIPEVTLSSDEETDQVGQAPSDEPDKSILDAEISPNDANAATLNITPNGQVSEAVDTVDSAHDKEATAIPIPVAIATDAEALEQLPGTSSCSDATKRSHPQASQSTPAKAAKASSFTPKKGSQQKTRRRSGSPKKQSREDNETALQKLLAAKEKELQEIGEEEVDLNDEENSAFLRRHRLSKMCSLSYKTLCRATGNSTKSGRAIESRVKLSENLTEFPEIEKAVEDFVNSGKSQFTPAFFEVNDVVESAVAAQSIPNLDAQKINSIARALFDDVIKKKRKKRELDSAQNGYPGDVCGAVLLGEGPPDPALESPELAAKLEANDRLRVKSQQEVEEKFVEIERELRSTNPEALENNFKSLSDESDQEKMADDDEMEVEEENGEMLNGEADNAPSAAGKILPQRNKSKP